MRRITLGHGGGGELTRELIEGVFARRFEGLELEDAAILNLSGRVAFTTDSFVVNPVFFPGGDLGKLAVCGTLNDLAVSGARPLFLSCGFILEEGLELDVLERIVASMAEAIREAKVRVVAGDTKVVEKGRGDGVFVNTTGLGLVERDLSYDNVRPGDCLIVSNFIGRHALAVFMEREKPDIDVELESDCANLYPLLSRLYPLEGLRWMRDATRGGVAAVACELAHLTGLGVEIYEDALPVDEQVAFLCEMFGFDPLSLANEGVAVIVVSLEDAERALEMLKTHPLGAGARVVGKIKDDFSGAKLVTPFGGERVIEVIGEDLLPRIC